MADERGKNAGILPTLQEHRGAAKLFLDWARKLRFNPAQLKRSVLSSTTQRTESYFGNLFWRSVSWQQ